MSERNFIRRSVEVTGRVVAMGGIVVSLNPIEVLASSMPVQTKPTVAAESADVYRVGKLPSQIAYENSVREYSKSARGECDGGLDVTLRSVRNINGRVEVVGQLRDRTVIIDPRGTGNTIKIRVAAGEVTVDPIISDCEDPNGTYQVVDVSLEGRDVTEPIKIGKGRIVGVTIDQEVEGKPLPIATLTAEPTKKPPATPTLIPAAASTATVAPTPIPAPVGPPAPGPQRPPIIRIDLQSCSIEMPLIPHWLIKMPSDWPAWIWENLWGTNPECADRNAINIVGWAATLLLYRNRRAARIAAGVPPLITIPVINYRFI